jgi:LysM repeat protein
VVAISGRGWRAYSGPVAVLLAATIVVALIRTELRHHTTPGGVVTPPHIVHPAVRTPPRRSLYVVRAGDTLDGIAGKTGTAAAKLLRLNPGISPTALFIGEKIHLR